ncbi:FAD-binding oxidoreductase [Sinorhizobium fredii]|uniref:FAD-binding oxidoreductase n=1 Tax=Rhizobium fredii TaxID=380 RepID=UPI003F8D5CB0
MHEVDGIVYALVGRYHGSISAEHGIGILKRDFLDRSRSPAELEVMRRIKTALDPNGILNPGKVLGR